MKVFAVLFCAVSIIGAAFGQNYNSAVKQAHNAVNQTESASQGSTQPTQPPPSAQPPSSQNPAQPMDPTLAATLQNISSLRADFDAMRGNFTPKSLTNDLMSATVNLKKPSADVVANLAGDLQTAIAGNEKMQTQCQKLAQDVHAIFNSYQLSPTQQQSVENDVQKILQDGGVASDKISAVVDDLKAVANETK